MKSVITKNRIKDPYCKQLVYYLANETNKPQLINIFYSTLIVTKYFNRSAIYCIGLILPFYITLPLYVLTYLEERRIIEEALNRSIIKETEVINTDLNQWFQYYHYVNETKISSKYSYIINNPSIEELENYQKVFNIPLECFESPLYINQVAPLFNSLNAIEEYKEELRTIVRNNDQIRSLYYLLQYFNVSQESINQILSYSKLCLTLQLNQQASSQQT